jgi:hypothetical protein
MTAENFEEAEIFLNDWMKANSWETVLIKIYPITNEEFVIERV